MFEVGWSELLVIALVAIVVIGPKDLPRVMRVVGQWSGKVKRMAREFQGQFNEALREAELDEVRKDVEAIGKIDPLGDVRREMAKAGGDIKKSMDVSAPAAAATPPSPTPAVPAPASETPAPAPQPVEAVTPPEPAAAAGEVKP
jgi:sec-independent protein translocase protein TatB